MHLHHFLRESFVLPRKAGNGVEIGKVFHFYGLNPSVMFTNLGSWRGKDFSQYKERRKENYVFPLFPGSDSYPSTESYSDKTGQPSERNDSSVLECVPTP